jgi:hypothetical protein
MVFKTFFRSLYFITNLFSEMQFDFLFKESPVAQNHTNQRTNNDLELHLRKFCNSTNIADLCVILHVNNIYRLGEFDFTILIYRGYVEERDWFQASRF